jgi:hypothetical protein
VKGGAEAVFTRSTLDREPFKAVAHRLVAAL